MNRSDEDQKRSALDVLKLGGNILTTVIDQYLLTKLERSGIHNDLGASFTSIQRTRNRIRKTAEAEGEAKLIDEIEWNLKFSVGPLGKHLPRITAYSLEPGNVFYEMKYYDYANLRKVIMLEMNANFFLKMRWRYLIKVLHENLWTEEHSVPAARDFVEKTHLNKYRTRIEQARNAAPFLSDILSQKTLSVNGALYLTPDLVIERLAGDENFRTQIRPERVYISHGDVHSNNILCGIPAKRMILLDCRGKSPDGTPYFDVAYDIAKIFHDLRSLYSLIEKHYFSVFMREDSHGISVTYEFNRRDLVERFRRNCRWVEQIIEQRLVEFGNLRYRANFTEAMLYLTMVPLHLRSEAEGLMCLITGIERLNEWLAEYHPAILEELVSAHVRFADSDRLFSREAR